MTDLAVVVTHATGPVLRAKADRRREARSQWFQPEDLSSLYAGVNVLVTKPQSTTEGFLPRILANIRQPIHYATCDASFVLPDISCTLVLRDVDALSESQQGMLLRWLEDGRHGTRHAISLTATHLFERVQAGTFSSALYYRLNMIYLDFRGSMVSRVDN